MTTNSDKKRKDQQTSYTVNGKYATRVLVCFSFALLLVSLLMIPVAASSPKQEILNYVKNNFPAQLYEDHLPLAENLLSQVELSEGQAKAVIETIEQVKEIPSVNNGASLSEYSKAEREQVLDALGEACEIMNVRYELSVSQGSSSKENTVAVFYNTDGVKLGEVDMDAVKKTDTPDEPPYGFAIAAVLLGIASIASLKLRSTVKG